MLLNIVTISYLKNLIQKFKNKEKISGVYFITDFLYNKNFIVYVFYFLLKNATAIAPGPT